MEIRRCTDTFCVGCSCELETSPFMEKANERSSHSSISGSALVIPLSDANPPSLLFYLSLPLVAEHPHLVASLCPHTVRKWVGPQEKMPFAFPTGVVLTTVCFQIDIEWHFQNRGNETVWVVSVICWKKKHLRVCGDQNRIKRVNIRLYSASFMIC